MGYFKDIYQTLSTLWEGMKVTLGYFTTARDYVTLQYPDEEWPRPERRIGVGPLESYNVIRSKLHVDIEDCIGCRQCERACPVHCIHIETMKGEKGEDLGKTKNGTQKRLLVTRFTIDMTECMYCDLCTFPCPEDCIYMTPDYRFERPDNAHPDLPVEARWRDRKYLIYEYATVSPEEVERRKAALEAAKAQKAAGKTPPKASGQTSGEGN